MTGVFLKGSELEIGLGASRWSFALSGLLVFPTKSICFMVLTGRLYSLCSTSERSGKNKQDNKLQYIFLLNTLILWLLLHHETENVHMNKNLMGWVFFFLRQPHVTVWQAGGTRETAYKHLLLDLSAILWLSLKRSGAFGKILPCHVHFSPFWTRYKPRSISLTVGVCYKKRCAYKGGFCEDEGELREFREATRCAGKIITDGTKSMPWREPGTKWDSVWLYQQSEQKRIYQCWYKKNKKLEQALNQQRTLRRAPDARSVSIVTG